MIPRYVFLVFDGLHEANAHKKAGSNAPTLQEASEISGITPHAIGCLLIALRAHAAKEREQQGLPSEEAAARQRRRAMAKEAMAARQH